MSYVGKKTRLFNTVDEPPEVPRKRSDGRLKNYNSATDVRAWSDITDEQRLYILDLVHQGGGKGLSLGKYIPIDVLIDTLLANKNGEIARLLNDIQILKGFLTPQQLADFERQRAAGDAPSRPVTAASSRVTSKVATSVEASKATSVEASKATSVVASRATSASPSRAGPSKEASSKAVSRAEDEAEEQLEAVVAFDNVEHVEAEKEATSSPPVNVSRPDADLSNYSKDELKQIIIQKDAEIISLKNALAMHGDDSQNQRKLARAAIEKLETVKDIIDERNTLRKKLEESYHELETLRKRPMLPGVDNNSCEKEIQELEEEIECMRAAKTCTPERETQIIRKELAVLKKYCSKLTSIQAENVVLKREMASLRNNKAMTDECDTAKTSRMSDLESKLKDYQQTVDERNQLRTRVHQLEQQLAEYAHLPNEVEVLRKRSNVLDEVMVERDSLHERLNQLKNIEKEVMELKKKAARVDELEKLLKETQGNSRELQNIKAERDMLRMKAADYTNLEQEIERLRYKAKESEVLRIERDRMKVRLDELAAIEVEFMQLLDRTKCLESIKAEREMYKSKYEELLGLECECDRLRSQMNRAKAIYMEKDVLEDRLQECECLITEQENEINKLLSHIDRLSQGHEEQQDRLKQSLLEMRTELSKKTALISTSEEQLATVQKQLKSTIANVSTEANTMKGKLDHYEKHARDAIDKLKEKQEEINYLHAVIDKNERRIADMMKEQMDYNELVRAFELKDKTICELRKDLMASREEISRLVAVTEKVQQITTDDHLQTMLHQSKLALQKVAEELAKGGPKSCPFVDKKSEIVEANLPDPQTEQKCKCLIDTVKCLKTQECSLIKQLRHKEEQNVQLSSAALRMEKLQTENDTLKKHSVEIQEVAKEQITELAKHLQKSHEKIEAMEAQASIIQHVSNLESIRETDNCAAIKEELERLREEKDKLEAILKEMIDLKKEKSAEIIGNLRSEYADLEAQLLKEIKLRQAGETRVKELEAQLNLLESQGDNKAVQAGLMQDNDNLRKHIDNLINEIEELKQENRQLKREIDKFIRAMGCDLEAQPQPQPQAELTAKPSKPEEQTDLIEEMNRLLCENDQLKSIIDELKRQLTEACKEVNEIGNLNDELRDELAQLRSKGGSDDCEKYILENKRLQTENDTLRKQLEDMLKEIERLKADTGVKPDTTSDDLRKQLEALMKENENLQKQIPTEDFSKYKTEADQLSKKIAELESEIERLKKQIADLLASKPTDDPIVLKTQIDDLLKRIADLEKELAAQKQKNADQADDFQKKLDAVPKPVAAPAPVTPVAPVVAAPVDDSEDLRKQLAEMQKAMDQLKGDNDKLKQQNDDLISSKPKDDPAKLQAEVNDLKSKLDELKTNSELLKAENDRLKNELDDLRKRLAEMEALRAEKDRLQKQLDDQAKQISDLTDQLKVASIPSGDDESKRQLEKELKEKQDLLDMIKNLESQLNSMRSEAPSPSMDELERLKQLLTEAELRAARAEQLMKDAEKRAVEAETRAQAAEEEARKVQPVIQGDDQEKLDQMRSKYEADMDELRKKLQELQKENQELKAASPAGDADYEAQLKALRDELAQQKKECQDTIAALKSQYDRDIKSLHNKHNDSVAKMQSSHEEVVKQIQGDLEKENESLRQAIVTTKPEEGLCTCGPPLEAIIRKIMEKGMEELLFEELQLLHTKTCEVTAMVLGKTKGSKRDKEIGENMEMPRSPRTEKEILKRQKHAQSQVQKLQIEITLERQRLEDLKNNLEKERALNSELVHRIRVQSRAVCNMQVERDIIKKKNTQNEEKLHRIITAMENEKAKIRQLEEILMQEKNQVSALKDLLNHERRTRSQPAMDKIEMMPVMKGPYVSQMAFAAPHTKTTAIYSEVTTVQDPNRKTNYMQQCRMMRTENLRRSKH